MFFNTILKIKLEAMGFEPVPVGHYVILKTTPQVFCYNPTLKMKLMSTGMDPDHIGFIRIAADYSARCGVRTHDSMMRPELKSGALTARPTWLRYIGFTADQIYAELFD